MPQRVRSGSSGCYTVPSPNKWSSRDVQQTNKEYLAEDSQCHGEGMVKQTTRGTMGLSNSLQNSDRDDTVSTGLWQDLPPSSWARVYVPLGNQEVEHGPPVSRDQMTNPTGWTGWMEGCNTQFIKGHKSSNHIRARIKSHIYTIEWIVYYSTYQVIRYNKASTNDIYYINDKMSDTEYAEA